MGIFARAASAAFRKEFDEGVGVVAGWHGLHAQTSPAGVAVTETRAMRVAAYATAVKVLAEDVAAVPLMLYRRTSDGKERAVAHPLYAVLHDAPNPEMTAMVWRETLQGHVIGWGNCYSEMVRDGSGTVRQLWPLRPDRIEPKRDEATDRLFWRYTLPSGETRDLAKRQVFHLPGLGFDGIVGYPFLSYVARDILAVAAAQQDYVGTFYANDARPGIYLKHPGRLSDEAQKRLLGTWDARHAGLTGAHRTAVLEEGMDIGTIGVSPVEQQLLEARKFSAVEIGGLLRLAPWKIGIYDRATWSNVEDGNIDHWQSALRAWFVRWEQQINLQVVGLGGSLFAEHLIDAILRGNAASRAAYYNAMRQASAITPDEIRDRENLNRRGGQADDLWAPMNMAPIRTADSAQPAAPPATAPAAPRPAEPTEEDSDGD